MGHQTRQSHLVWALAERQHDVLAVRQLADHGYNRDAINHRLGSGRLYKTPFRGVYAVGRAALTTHGRWMAGVLSCGEDAVLSHESAAALWRFCKWRGGPVHVSVPGSSRSRNQLVVHRRVALDPTTAIEGIPVTGAFSTMLDIAPRVSMRELEAAINEADKLGVLRADELAALVDAVPGRPGVATLRKALDAGPHRGTDSDLERRFLRLVRGIGLPAPVTQAWVNGFRVDFWWPELALIVETDGLTYHRTALQQARDRRRDQVHAAAGITTLRFTNAQIRREIGHVEATMRAVVRRLAGNWRVS